MTRALLIPALAVFTSAPVLVARAQAPAAIDKPGIYLDGTGADLRKLPMETSTDMEVKGVGKTMLTQGIMKPKQVVRHAGARSAFVIKGAMPAFLFKFPPKNMPAQPSAMMAMSGDSALPFGTKHPKDFTLAQPVVEGDARIFDTGKIQKIKFEIEQLKPDTFRVRVTAPLTPGEYAFFWNTGGGAPSMIWSFSYQS